MSNISKKRTAAVIVTRNRKALLMQCISKLLIQQARCDILIIDNDSKDGTQEAIYELLESRIKYKNTGTNLGGAGGFNYGIRWAIEDGYDYVWIMDDDTLPEPNALKELLIADRILDSNYGFLSSAVLWTDGHECHMNRQKIQKSYFNYLEYLQYSIIQIEQATFVSLLIPAHVINRIGLPIKEYFIWGDDIEYTRRIAVHIGLPCFLVGKSFVIHAMKSNCGTDLATDEIERLPRYHLAYRNGVYTYSREGSRGRCYYIARCCRDFFHVWRYARDHHIRRSWAIIAGYGNGLKFHPQIEFIETAKPDINRFE